MTEDTTKAGVSRRTLAKGAAWSVPAVAVAAAAPAYASSIPEPEIEFGKACGNTGATKKGCGNEKSLQVPLTLSNPTGSDIVFQVTSMYTCNCATAPTAPGTGVYPGVFGIFSTPSHTVDDHNDCTTVTASNCTGGVASVVVPAGTVNATYWIVSATTDNSSTFSTTINWRLLDAECNVLDTGAAQTTHAIAPQNCGSDKAPATTQPDEPATQQAEAPVEERKVAAKEAPAKETASVEPKQEPKAEEPKSEEPTEPTEPAVEPSEPATEG